MWKHSYGSYNTYRQLDLPAFSSDLVEIGQQVKIVYVGANGIIRWNELGMGIAGQKSGLQTLLSYRTRLEMGYYI